MLNQKERSITFNELVLASLFYVLKINWVHGYWLSKRLLVLIETVSLTLSVLIETVLLTRVNMTALLIAVCSTYVFINR